VNCADTKVDKNIGIFAAQFMRPPRNRHLARCGFQWASALTSWACLTGC